MFDWSSDIVNRLNCTKNCLFLSVKCPLKNVSQQLSRNCGFSSFWRRSQKCHFSSMCIYSSKDMIICQKTKKPAKTLTVVELFYFWVEGDYVTRLPALMCQSCSCQFSVRLRGWARFSKKNNFEIITQSLKMETATISTGKCISYIWYN